MSLSRSEVGAMEWTMLLIVSDRLRDRLLHDWDRGRPGKLTDLYDLAIVYSEAVVRGRPLPAPRLPGQLEFDLAGAVEVVQGAHRRHPLSRSLGGATVRGPAGGVEA